MKRFGAYYAATRPGFPVLTQEQLQAIHQWFAFEYEASGSPEHGAALKAINPEHKSLNYKSGTDSYHTYGDGGPIHPEAFELEQICVSMGINPEAPYMHWAEDTVIEWWGQPPYSVSYPSGTRVELYRGASHSGNRVRRGHCFTEDGRPALHEMWRRRAAGYDGLFLDNTANILSSWGVKVLSGGMVAEAGVKMDAKAFHDWHWANLRPTLTSFDLDGKMRMINAGSYWHDDYVNYPVAERIFMENQGSPFREWQPWDVIALRNALAAQKSVGIAYSGHDGLGTPPVTWEQLQYACLCQYFMVQSETTSTHIQDWTGPYRVDWAQRVTSPAQARAVRMLGNATNQPTLLPGAGPKVWERMYGRPGGGGGAIWMRNMIPFPGGPTNDVIYRPRPPQMLYLAPSGALEKPDQVPIPNGSGAILVRA